MQKKKLSDFNDNFRQIAYLRNENYKNKEDKKMKILLIRFSSFGDVVLTAPVIRAIKDKYPESEIDFIVYTAFSEGVTLNPMLRKVIQFDRKKSKDSQYIKETIESLRKEEYDYIIDLHSKFLSRIIGKKLSLSRKNKTEYLRYKKRKWWKTLLVKARLIDYNADCTIVESYFTSLKRIGIFFNRKNIESGLGDNLEFYIDKNEEEKFVKKYELDKKKYIVLAPGASKTTKKWPYYDNLAQEILKNSNAEIFVIGGREDFGNIRKDKSGRITDLCGKISFKESGIILKYAILSVVNDSGPFHISRALKTETYVFFGPTDPKLFSFEKSTHLFYNENCKPHSLYGDDKFPKKYKDCMTGISVEKVFDEIIKKYNEINN